jgi:hypothetical protein
MIPEEHDRLNPIPAQTVAALRDDAAWTKESLR